MAHSLAHVAASRYLELINAQAFHQIGSLFAEDAVVLGPAGDRVVGRQAITSLWGDDFSKTGPSSVTAASMVCEGNVCVAEISPHFPGEAAPRENLVVDHFTVNGSGEITRLAIYLRPPSGESA